MSDYPYYRIDGVKVPLSQLADLRKEWKKDGLNVVTTNGCFDLLHTGHTRFLKNARSLGDKLIVGINSDASVHTLKGAGKPILNENERAEMLLALSAVDAVLVYDELLPNHFLELIQPDIHCKAADYTEESLPEAAVVKANGGKVKILPLVEGTSSTNITDRILEGANTSTKDGEKVQNKDLADEVLTYLLASSNIYRQTAYKLKDEIVACVGKIIETLENGNKILLCGNGGSASDAQHIAAEFVGRFKRDRKALPAIALTTDTSIITAVGNDYGFEQIFSRQIEALGNKGDLLIAISTSGHSANVVRAVKEAKDAGIFVVGLSGEKSSPLHDQADLTLAVPSSDTALIQQVHIGIMHLLCDIAEKKFTN